MATQLEQLLTCCICLDRFRNPKLLPCQHSVCMEPCMEGLVDYVRRQVKCPECRAEHRIPYNGVQGYPTNVTLQRFLEAHIEITGEQPDPHTGQVMERCAVCNEKNYLTTCSHCDKKICDDCKSAHSEILKREIGRINNQVKRSLHRLKDQQTGITRHINTLKNNADSVIEEIDSIERRLLKAVRDRSSYLKNEADNYYNTELRNLKFVKDGLEQEVSNAESNSELADKHMNDQIQWDDCELMDAKEIFLRTMEFIRGFDYDSGEFNRRARFNPPDDLKKIISQVGTVGEFIVNNPKQPIESYSTSALSGGLMKSKSDHRLAAQFREQEDNLYTTGRSTSPCHRRKFGERPAYNENYEDSTSDLGRKRFRSRFIRRDEEEDKSSRGEDDAPKPRQRVIDTEDVSRGPLSGITRMSDSPRVIQRLRDKDSNINKKKDDPVPKCSTPPTTQSKSFSSLPQRKVSRQLSKEDEIDKIKKQNKSESSLASISTPTPKTTYNRANSIKENTDQLNRATTDRTHTTPRTSTHSSSILDDDTSRTRDHTTNRVDSNIGSSPASRKTSVDVGPSISQRTRSAYSRSPSSSSIGESSKLLSSRNTKPLDTASTERRHSRSHSSDSNRSLDGTTSSRTGTGATFGTEESKNRFQPKSTTSRGSGGSTRFQSRFLGRAGTPSAETSRGSGNDEDDDDDEDESSEESDSEDTDETSEEEEDKANYGRSSNAVTGRSSQAPETSNYNSTGPSSNDSGYSSKYGSSTNSSINSNSRYGISSTTNESKGYQRPSYLDNTKSNKGKKEETFESKYPYATGQGSSRAKFEELKEKRQRLARSKSSAGVEEDDSATNTPISSYRSQYGKENDANATSRAGAHNSTNSDDSSQLSNWARYLKNKYGNRPGASSSGPSGLVNSTSALARSRSSHLLGLAKDDSSEDDSKNVVATPTTRAAGILGPTPFGNIHRNQYLQKQRTHLKIGSRGSEAGNFTWPRGIAIGPDNIIVVADSSNHRVQVFDQHGNYQKEFGKYGNGDGQFDCLAGVAVNKIGQFIIADRYNHRIQIFESSGSFLRSFGSQGNSDGKFSYPWGIATDSLGYIYVCDKENHRVQVFQSDGTFAGKFGAMGNKPGQLEHPHYIAVSSTNQVIVSDSNNHRVQIFDVNGKVLASFGSEGSEEGQFKFPRGVAVDEQNYIFVADSGNNRIQIFNSEGAFLRSFGGWGSADGEFKGLEGVAVTRKGKILVCDRENHRVQIF